MSLWTDSGLYRENKPQPPLSKVDKFKKQQFDDTKVGKIEEAIIPKVASAIESGKKGRFGWFVNPAMGIVEGISKHVIQPLTQGISTALLTPQAMMAGKGNPIQSFRFAKEQSKRISYGAALATTAGQFVSPYLPDQITPTFMDDNFDIFNDKQRDRAFRDEWIGIFASGGTDLAGAILGTKGTGIAMRAGARKTIGPKKIVTTEDMNKFKAELEDAVSQQALPVEQRTRTGLTILFDDLVAEKDLSKLSTNPFILESNNPYRTATIISRLDNHRDVADYLMAERGDNAAFLRFMESNPLKADHLDNYGIVLTKPISDFADVGLDELSPKLTQRYQKVIDAKKATDRDFADALENMLTSKTVENYRPGKYAALETLDLTRRKIANQAQYGDLKLFGAEGNNAWKVSVYQSEPYDRMIRLISWMGSGRPQGHINVSNPRKFEAASDLRSDLNRIMFLKGAEGVVYKRKAVDRFLRAQDNITRTIVLTEIEQEVLQMMAKRYGVTDLQDVRTMEQAIAEMKSWHLEKSNKRQDMKSYAAKNGYIPEDGVVNVQNWLSPTTEPNTLPMLDFRKLEQDVIIHLKGTPKVSSKDVTRAKTAKVAMTLGEFFDVANMAFSNMNLLRVAYIPKNSGVDPIARASMALESTEIIRNALPGISNLLYNSSLRVERLKKFIPGSPRYKARKIAKDAEFNIRKFRQEIEPKVVIWENAKKTADDADKILTKATSTRDRLAAKAARSNDPDIHAAAQEAQDNYYKAASVYNQAQNALTKSADEMNGYAKLIEAEQKRITPFAISEGDLKKIKTLGMEKETIVSASGKKYTIAGLADPNIRGVSPYMDEIDSSINFYAASMQSEISRRLKYDSSKFVTIARNEGKPYWNGLSHLANREIRQELDLPLGMLFRGDSKANVLNWLFSSKGANYRKRLQKGFHRPRPLTRDEVSAWIDETQDTLMRYFPDEKLRATILTRNVSPKEVESFLGGRLDLPKTIKGPNIKLNELNWFEKKYAQVTAGFDLGWKILSYSENRMARNPLFLIYARQELKTLINSAERAGRKLDTHFINHELRDVAMRNALARVERTLYSSRRLTNGMYLARYAMSFPLAFFNSQLVAMRLIARNPINAYWYNSIQTALDDFQAYEDRDGNTYKSISDVPKGTSVTVKFPLHGKIPNWASVDALKPYTDVRGGGLRVNPKQLEFMIADPSVSWFGGATISQLIKNGFGIRPWKVYGEDIAKAMRNSLGDDIYESSILYGGYPVEGESAIDTVFNVIFPGYGKSIFDGFRLMFGGGSNGSERALDEIVNQYKVAYAEWDRNGRSGNPPTPEQAAKSAGAMMFIRAVVQFNAAIAIGFDPVTRAATAYYADLVEEFKGDYDMAQKIMIEQWGVDSLALIGSSKRNNAGLAATNSDIKIIRNFEGLLSDMGRYGTKYAGMLSSGYDNDLTTNSKYSAEVAAIYKRLNFPGTVDLPITQRKNISGLGGIREEVEARRGWAEYQKAQEWRDAMMYQYGIRSTQEVMYELSGIKEYYDNMVYDISNQFPGWTQAYNDGREDYWRGLIPTVEKISNDTKWRSHAYKNGDKWEEIAYWLEQAKNFKRLYSQTANTDDRKLRLKTEFAQFHYDYLQTASDDFAAFAYRWLNIMPELNEELAVRE